MVSLSISNSDMKRFICVAVSVASGVYALLLVNEWVNLRLIFSSTNTTTYKMYRLFNEERSGEIPILGSSRAEAGFAPSELSPSAFNYGLSGSGQWETLLHLKAVCSRKDARLVIINLDPWGIGGKVGFQGNYLFAYGSPVLKEYENQVKVAFVDRCPGFRLYGKLRNNLASCLNSVTAATKKIDNGAILQRLSRNPTEWEYIISKCPAQKFNLNKQTWNEYKRVLAANQNVKVVFVVSPVSPPWWERFSGKAELSAFLVEASKIKNVAVLDMCSSNINKYDLSCFMDLTHLNENGARRFSRELKAALERKGILL